MGFRKKIINKASRAVGGRVNHYSDDNDNQRENSEFQKTIETISDKVDVSTASAEMSDDTGTPGSLRVIKDGKDWYLEFNTKDGWIRSNNTSVSGFSLRN